MRLAPQEQRYTELVVNGDSDKEISRAMNITLNSVRSLAKRVRFKLHADNKTEVAVHAIREGLVSLCLIFCMLSGLFTPPAFEDDLDNDMPFRNRRSGTLSRTVRTLPTIRVLARV